MREDIGNFLNYLEIGEDEDITQKVSAIRNYINELNSKIERMQIRLEMLELINFYLIRKEVLKNEKS